MGIKKITGVVLARRAGFLKVLLDSRKDDGYDILEASMAARKLNVGDRFSLYATSSMVKLVKGKKVYTYKDATEQPDGYEIYELILNAKQLKIINVKIQTFFIHMMKKMRKAEN